MRLLFACKTTKFLLPNPFVIAAQVGRSKRPMPVGLEDTNSGDCGTGVSEPTELTLSGDIDYWNPHVQTRHVDEGMRHQARSLLARSYGSLTNWMQELACQPTLLDAMLGAYPSFSRSSFVFV